MFPMTKMLISQPTDGDEWKRKRQHHEHIAGRAFTDMPLQYDKPHDQWQDAIHHVPQQQSPVKKFHCCALCCAGVGAACDPGGWYCQVSPFFFHQAIHAPDIGARFFPVATFIALIAALRTNGSMSFNLCAHRATSRFTSAGGVCSIVDTNCSSSCMARRPRPSSTAMSASNTPMARRTASLRSVCRACRRCSSRLSSASSRTCRMTGI